MGETLEVGFVGLANRYTQLAGYVEESGHDIVACADVRTNLGQKFAERHGAALVEDHHAVIDADPDAIIVGAPNRFKEKIAIDALAADVDVLVDKPLSSSLAGAKRMMEAERSSNAFGMAGFPSRFREEVQTILQRIKRNELGDVYHVDATYVRRRGIPGIGSWYTNERLSGGGVLMDIGSIIVYNALAMLEFPEIREVTGVTSTQFGNKSDYVDPNRRSEPFSALSEIFTVEDFASGYIKTDGATITLEVAWAANRPVASHLVVWGTERGARVPIEGPDRTTKMYGAGSPGTDHFIDSEVVIPPRSDRPWEWTALEVFFDHVGGGAAPDGCSFEEGVIVQRVIQSIYDSATTD